MENTTIAAIITASGAVIAGAWALLKPKARDIPSVAGSVVDSAVAVGTNITQTFAPTVHNHYTTPVNEVQNPVGEEAFSTKTESRPTFAEIMDDLAKARPPYEANQRYKHYEGVRVCWLLTVYGVWETSPEGRTTVCLIALDGGPHDMVTLEVNLVDYPKLRVVERGHRTWAEGLIRSVSDGQVYLESGSRLILE